MKPIMTDIEALYNKREPTGEAILDEIISYLRLSRIIAAADLALLMDVKRSYLYGAVHILTGMSLGDFISRWRLLQARELLSSEPSSTRRIRTSRLNEVAHRCGWSSYRVMLRVAQRYEFALTSPA